MSPCLFNPQQKQFTHHHHHHPPSFWVPHSWSVRTWVSRDICCWPPSGRRVSSSRPPRVPEKKTRNRWQFGGCSETRKQRLKSGKFGRNTFYLVEETAFDWDDCELQIVMSLVGRARSLVVRHQPEQKPVDRFLWVEANWIHLSRRNLRHLEFFVDAENVRIANPWTIDTELALVRPQHTGRPVMAWEAKFQRYPIPKCNDWHWKRTHFHANYIKHEQ